MKLTQGYWFPKEERGLFDGYFSFKTRSSPSNAHLESAGETIPPWGVPIRCFVKDVFFHVPGFQPLLENNPVHRDMSHEPIVGNSIKTASDVTF